MKIWRHCLFLCLMLAGAAGPARPEDCLDYGVHLRWLGYCPPAMSSIASGISADGYMATIDSQRLVRFVDASDPRALRVVSQLDTPGLACHVTFDGDIAFISDWWNGIQVVDFSDPAAPVIIANLLHGNVVYRCSIQGDRAYASLAINTVARTSVCVLDISDPRHPVEIGRTPVVDSYVSSIAAAGDYLYLGKSYGLAVVDMHNPQSPVLAGVVSSLRHDVALVGGFLYAIDTAGRLGIYDLASPLAPQLVSQVPEVLAEYLAASGNLVYAIDNLGKLSVLDATNAVEPVIRAQFTVHEANGQLIPDGDRLLAGSWAGVHIFAGVTRGSPALLGAIILGIENRNLTLDGGYAYLPDHYQGALRIVDVRNPAAPVRVANLVSLYAPWDVAVRAGYAYVTIENGLRVLDVTNPAAPRTVNTVALPSQPRGLELRGDFAYVAAGWQGLAIVDISTPAAAHIVGACNPTPNKRSMAITVDGPYAYETVTGMGLSVIDVSVPAAPVAVAALALTDSVAGLARHGTLLYVTAGDEGVHVVDVAQPTAPRLVRTLAMPGEAMNATVAEGRLYVAGGLGGMSIFDLDTPDDPQYLGFQPMPGGVTDVLLSDGLAYTASGSWRFHGVGPNGLQILPAACPPPPLAVTIDVLPGHDRNRVDCRGRRRDLLPVAILTTAGFDALQVDSATVRFGPAGAVPVAVRPPHGNGNGRGRGRRHGGRGDDAVATMHEVDVDRDGDLDQLYHFRVSETGLECGDTEATLVGATVAGRGIQGTDSITTRPRDGDDGHAGRGGLAAAPNPFNPATTLAFERAAAGRTRLTIHDLAGRVVRVLLEADLPAGRHEVTWDGRDGAGRAVAAGAYLARLEGNGPATVVRLGLVK